MKIKKRIQRLVQGYQQWVTELVDGGWKPYEISLMFNQLPGSQRAILEQNETGDIWAQFQARNQISSKSKICSWA
jgi:hypothetical protein